MSAACCKCPTGRSTASASWSPTTRPIPSRSNKAIEEEPRFAEMEMEKEPAVGRLLDIAQKLEGLYRNASTHAAGVVIGDRPLSSWCRCTAIRARTCRHPVQHEMGRAGGPGEVRLPRPQDADRAPERGRPDRQARSCIEAIDLEEPDQSRSTTSRPTRCLAPRRSACSRWNRSGMRKALLGMKPTASRTSSRWSRSTGPGPMENIPKYCPSRTARRNAPRSIR
jgi:DNA polymerase-3 subunit alpha